MSERFSSWLAILRVRSADVNRLEMRSRVVQYLWKLVLSFPAKLTLTFCRSMDVIREYLDDSAALRECVVALQESERSIDPRLRPGETMADAYCELIHDRCKES